MRHAWSVDFGAESGCDAVVRNEANARRMRVGAGSEKE